MATGIKRRHSASCASRSGGRCNCRAGWEATVFSRRDGKKIRKVFAREAEARSWRADSLAALERGVLRAPTKTRLREAAEEWLAGAERGEVRTRSGHIYKPSTLRGYRQAVEMRISPHILDARLAAITTGDLQEEIDRWMAEGLPPSTIRNAIKPLQAIYRRARSRGGLPVNPTRDLELPAPRSKEVEIVSPSTAADLLAIVPAADRAIWGTALYAGLRYGELRALRWGAVDLAGGTIAVRESWDPREGAIEPKTRTSRRVVPLPAALRELLMDRRLLASAKNGDLAFGDATNSPFHAATLYRRADAAWRRADIGHRLRLHQSRHTYASFMIAAGVNAKALSVFMGHSSIKVTFDLYGHLMPGAEAEAAALLDRFLRVDRDEAVRAARNAGSVLLEVPGRPAGEVR